MNGFVNILKPTGYTSSDVVVKVRKALSKELGYKVKVGHMGTLDPYGTGVLPLAIGTATKLFDYLIGGNKTYFAGITLGKETDTLDSYGEIIKTDNKVFSINDINRVLSQNIGEINQLPPQYSAKKINGEKAYDIARRGEFVELKRRKVSIYNITASEGKSINNFDIKVDCSGGTYIRSLVRDIAYSLDTVGYMSYIIRTKSVGFDIKDSVTIDEFLRCPLDYIIPIEKIILPMYNSYELPEDKKDLALNGVKIKLKDMPTGMFVLTYQGNIIGMAENVEGKLIIKNRL